MWGKPRIMPLQRHPAERPPRIRVHSLDHARAALAAARDAGMAIVLESPVGAAGWQGVGWWRELVRLGRAEFPDAEFEAVLDCGAAPGHALAAIRAGIATLRLRAPDQVLAKIADIAEQAGGRVERGAPGPLIDLLGAADPRQYCGDRLSSGSSCEPLPPPGRG